MKLAEFQNMKRFICSRFSFKFCILPGGAQLLYTVHRGSENRDDRRQAETKTPNRDELMRPTTISTPKQIERGFQRGVRQKFSWAVSQRGDRQEIRRGFRQGADENRDEQSDEESYENPEDKK